MHLFFASNLTLQSSLRSFTNALHRNRCCFATELGCCGLRNSRTGSVLKSMGESCAGRKEIENPSISPNQDADGPNHDDEILELSASKGWSIELKYMPLFYEKQLNDKILNNLETMQDKVAPKAHPNKL